MIGYDILHEPPGEARTVIVLPGIPGSRRLKFASGALEQVRARIVVTERPGFGITPPQQGRTLVDHAAQIVEVADELGAQRFAALGISGGGAYALACGALHPERVAVVGLLSAHVSSFDRPDADPGMSPGAQLVVAGMREDPAGTREAIASFLQPDADAYTADPDAFKEKWTAEAAAQWGFRPEEIGDWGDLLDDTIGQPVPHSAEEYALTNGPLGFAFDDVRVPVRAFHGTADTTVPIEGMRDLVNRLPDATLVEWGGATHYVSAERNRELFDALAAFL